MYYSSRRSESSRTIDERKENKECHLGSFQRHSVDVQGLKDSFRQHLARSGYSPSSVINYTKGLGIFLKMVHPQDPLELGLEDINYFFSTLPGLEDISPSYLNHLISAVKLFYKLIGKRTAEECRFSRPSILRKRPQVLNRDEIKNMILLSSGKKRKLILKLFYGTGLRPGEVVKIKRSDLNIAKGILKIDSPSNLQKAKRRIEIPENLRPDLDTYLKEYNPIVFLFEGRSEGQPIGQRSLELMVKEAGKVAGVPFSVTCMVIRHSFAVHLIEAGINIHYLKEILGLRSTVSVNHYLDVARFRKPNSPLDEIMINS